MQVVPNQTTETVPGRRGSGGRQMPSRSSLGRADISPHSQPLSLSGMDMMREVANIQA